MHHHLYFNQDCPICHRGMRVPIEWFGTEIRCARCSHPGSLHSNFEPRTSASQAVMEAGRRASGQEPDRSV